MSSVHQLALNQLYASLELDRKAIGVRFLFTKEEYDACPVPPAKAKMAYCVMVKVASSGICLKADLSLFGCGGATVPWAWRNPAPPFAPVKNTFPLVCIKIWPSPNIRQITSPCAAITRMAFCCSPWKISQRIARLTLPFW